MATILLVDDDPTLLGMIAMTLRNEGFAVVTAGSATEALSLVPREVDLLITEVHLPGMDGMVLAAKLLGEHPAIRVLFLSGSMDPLSLGGSLQFEFMAKPFPLNVFVAEVRKLLQPLAVPSGRLTPN